MNTGHKEMAYHPITNDVKGLVQPDPTQASLRVPRGSALDTWRPDPIKAYLDREKRIEKHKRIRKPNVRRTPKSGDMPVGQRFKYEGRILEVAGATNECTGCHFDNNGACTIKKELLCCETERADGNDVVFKQ